ncbi:hypothetical protein N9L68_09240 [bacterium]|nr:hypothetical protein [bacterium]
MAQVYGEVWRGTATVIIDVRKCRAVIHACAPSERKRHRLGDGIQLAVGAADTDHIGSVIDYFWGLRILGYAYSTAGPEDVDSRVTVGSRVRNCPFDVNPDNADVALRECTTSRISGRLAMARARRGSDDGIGRPDGSDHGWGSGSVAIS